MEMSHHAAFSVRETSPNHRFLDQTPDGIRRDHLTGAAKNPLLGAAVCVSSAVLFWGGLIWAAFG
jgi:hypothetical protein